MLLYQILKWSFIIAAVLAFTGLGINSSNIGGEYVQNNFLRRNVGLCLCVMLCAYLLDNSFRILSMILLLGVIFFLIVFIVEAIKTRKINDAIRYGIKGTYWTKYYDDDYEKFYLVRRYTYLHDFGKCSSSDNRENYYGLLDLYDNETHKFIRTVSKELLWEMIKKHISKDKVHSQIKTYCSFAIMYPKLQYGAYRIDVKKFKDIAAQYGSEHNITIEYKFVSSGNALFLMIYNQDISQLEKDLPELMNLADEYRSL